MESVSERTIALSIHGRLGSSARIDTFELARRPVLVATDPTIPFARIYRSSRLEEELKSFVSILQRWGYRFTKNSSTFPTSSFPEEERERRVNRASYPDWWKKEEETSPGGEGVWRKLEGIGKGRGGGARVWAFRTVATSLVDGNVEREQRNIVGGSRPVWIEQFSPGDIRHNMLDTWIGSRSRSAHKSILTPWMLHRFVVNRETVQNVAFIGARQWRCSGLGLVRFSLFLLWTRARAAWTINDRLSKVARCTLLTATFLSAPRICIKHNRGVTLAVRSSYYWNISCRAFHRQIVKAHLCRLLGGWPLVTVATYRPVLLSLDFSFSLFFFFPLHLGIHGYVLSLLRR